MRVEVERIRDRRLEVRARGMTIAIDRMPHEGEDPEGFRPTELLLGALGACMVGTMLAFADNEGIDVQGVTVELEDTETTAPRRIESIDVTMRVRADVPERRAATLERVASRCKIHTTLASTPEVRLSFETEAPL